MLERRTSRGLFSLFVGCGVLVTALVSEAPKANAQRQTQVLPSGSSGDDFVTRIDGDQVFTVPRSTVGASVQALGGPDFGFASQASGYGMPAYVVRVLTHPKREQFMRSIKGSAAQIEAIIGRSVTVDPNPLQFDRNPIAGEIIFYIGTTSPCGAFINGLAGCGGWLTSNGTLITSGKVWLGETQGCSSSTNGLVMHEMGHAFGLDHYWPDYESRAQVMSYSFIGNTYRSGDRRGFGALAGRNGLSLPVETPAFSSASIGSSEPVFTARLTPEPSVAAAVTNPAAVTLFSPKADQRVFDSRSGTPFANGETRLVNLSGLVGLPAGQLDSVTANITVAGAQNDGYVTIYPADSPQPPTSNVNYQAGRDVANASILKLNALGQVKVVNVGGPAHILIDVSGAFSAQYSPFTGSGFVPVAPLRLLDTRTDSSVVDARNLLQPGEQLPTEGCGRTRYPDLNRISSSAFRTGLVLNVTAVNSDGAGYLSVLTSFVPPNLEPTTSSINLSDGDTRANLSFTSGYPYIRNSNSRTGGMIADLAGYFVYKYSDTTSAGFVASVPTRVADSRGALGLPGRLTGSASLSVTPPASIDGSKVLAVAINLTVTDSQAAGYLSASPTGFPLPNASNVNFQARETVANLAIVKVGAGNSINLYSSAGNPHVIGDVVGYFVGP
jgi:hypothetical protein